MFASLDFPRPAVRGALLVLSSIVGALLTAADVPGFAEIRQPASGQAVSGVVSIAGTATHPGFESYELAFSYDPNPTGTWFSIGEAIDTPVIDGRLAIWDTSGISDGSYQIRLTVNLGDQEPLTATVSGIQVLSGAIATPEPQAAAPLAPTAGPTADVPLEAAQAVSPAAPVDPFRRALMLGIVTGAALVAVVATYAWLAPRVRAYSGYLKTRRLHRRVERDRSRSSGA